MKRSKSNKITIRDQNLSKSELQKHLSSVFKLHQNEVLAKMGFKPKPQKK